MPSGIKEQIDDLDQLLDQLLKLPIDRVKAAPVTIPMKPRVATITENEVDIEEAPTLRMHDVVNTSKPVLALVEEGDVVDEQVPVAGSGEAFKTLSDEPTHSLSLSIEEPHAPDPSPRGGEGSQAQQSQPLPVEEIPWIDDEPLPAGPGKGPQVEIILGPTSNVVVSSQREETRTNGPAAKRRGWIYWLFWMVTWCFDNTFGHWLPWLRRPSIKLLLGLIGVALCAVSIYLVWTGWLR